MDCKNVSRETFLQSTHTLHEEKAAALLRGGIKSGTLFGGSFCKGQFLCGGQFVVACRRGGAFRKGKLAPLAAGAGLAVAFLQRHNLHAYPAGGYFSVMKSRQKNFI